MGGTVRDDLVTARCRAADEAEYRGAEIYYPHRLSVLQPATPFEMRVRAAQIGPLMVGVLHYSDEVYIETDDLETSYEVNIPLDGRFLSRSGPDATVADPATAAVYRPYGKTSFRGFAGGGTLVGLKIDRHVLEQQLGALADRDVKSPVSIASSIDLRSGPGLDWWIVTRAIVDLLDRREGLLSNPLVTRPLAQSALTGLLLAVDHPYRDQLLTAPSPAATPVVQHAIDLLESSPEEPWTVVDLAARVGTSVRALQAGFRWSMDMSPMDCLRRLRLRRVRADLLIADPGSTSVSTVASRWGFTHLGRFAAVYRAQYGELPSRTLQSSG